MLLFLSRKALKRLSDITIDVFWEFDKILPDFDDNKGTSCVLIQTIKGKSYFDRLNINTIEVKYNTVLQGNPSLEKSTILNKKKKETFFKSLLLLSLNDNIEKQTQIPIYKRIINKIRRTINTVKQRLILMIKDTNNNKGTTKISYYNI